MIFLRVVDKKNFFLNFIFKNGDYSNKIGTVGRYVYDVQDIFETTKSIYRPFSFFVSG